jgi:putative endonuclease
VFAPLTANLPKDHSVATSSNGTWQCYILHCADGTLYTGITNNMGKRLAAHNAGAASKYTRGRGPVELVFVEDCTDRSAALKQELAIKNLAREEKLLLIQSGLR